MPCKNTIWSIRWCVYVTYICIYELRWSCMIPKYNCGWRSFVRFFFHFLTSFVHRFTIETCYLNTIHLWHYVTASRCQGIFCIMLAFFTFHTYIRNIFFFFWVNENVLRGWYFVMLHLFIVISFCSFALAFSFLFRSFVRLFQTKLHPFVHGKNATNQKKLEYSFYFAYCVLKVTKAKKKKC